MFQRLNKSALSTHHQNPNEAPTNGGILITHELSSPASSAMSSPTQRQRKV